MAKFKDKLKYLLVFLVSFSLGMTFVAVADRFIAKRMIKRDAKVLADKFHMYLYESADKLLTLPSLAAPIGCTADIEKLLKQTTFDANFIRWVAITKDNRVVCQIDETNHNIETISSHKIKESISIGVAAEITNSHHEIFLIRHMDGYDYMASITPLRPYYFVPLDCRRCLEYRVSLDSEPYFEFGLNNFDDEEVVSSSVVHHGDFYRATFSLSGNQLFLDQYSQMGWEISLLTGLILAALACVMYWRWLTVRMSLLGKINRGIAGDEFVPFYQPIVDGISGQMVGAEVLVRWQRPNGSYIPPNHFIPFAESHSVIIPMTESMLRLVIEDIKQHGAALPELFFSINIVPAHL